MKKNRILTLAAAAVLMSSANMAYGQAYKDYEVPEGAAAMADEIIRASEQNADNLDALMKTLNKKFKGDKKALGIGKYFFDKKCYARAIDMAQRVYNAKVEAEATPDLPELHLEGDCYSRMAEMFPDQASLYNNMAVGKFAEAITIKENDPYAYFQQVNVYNHISPEYSIELMNTIKEKYPNDPNIDKTMAWVYYNNNMFGKADTTFQVYFDKVKYADDVEASTHFAIVKYAKKDYQGSLDIVKAVLDKDPTSIALNRMSFYNNVELGNLDEAAQAGKDFLGKGFGALYNMRDYLYMGAIAASKKDKAMTNESLDKAMEMTTKNATDYKDISKNYELVKEYEKAFAAYAKYIEASDNPKAVNREEFQKDRIYYRAATDEELSAEDRTKYAKLGFDAFQDLAKKDAEGYNGPYYAAICASLFNPEDAVEEAKLSYEETLKRLEGKGEDYNERRSGCWSYIAFYNFRKAQEAEKSGAKDTAKPLYLESKAAAAKALEFDETNNMASQISEVLKDFK